MKILNTHQFIEKANNIHNFKYRYPKAFYRGSRSKIKITCPEHGEFIQSAADHLSGYGCKLCGRDKISLHFKYTFEKFVQKANKVHKNKYRYNEKSYTNSSSKTLITCLDHGDFEQRANAHLSGQGCPKCMFSKLSILTRSNTEEFIKKAKQIHGDKNDYSKTEYIDSSTKVCVTCLIDNHGDFWVTPNNHLNKKSNCPKCNLSKGELAIKAILDKHNIKYIHQYRIPEVINRYEYDFYLPEYKTLIEFHGIQHYEPIEFFGGEDNLSYVKRNDEIKKHLADLYKYRFLEFNYKQFKFMSPCQFETFTKQRIINYLGRL